MLFDAAGIEAVRFTRFFMPIRPDGKRFLMLKDVAPEGPRKINIVINWFEELKQRVPRK
jgi:hypothetical protein